MSGLILRLSIMPVLASSLIWTGPALDAEIFSPKLVLFTMIASYILGMDLASYLITFTNKNHTRR